MSESPTRELAGLAAVGVAICCGLPALLGAGALGAAAGIALGSTLVAAAGAAIGVLGWLRWRRRHAGPTDHAVNEAPSKPGAW
jgi:hypothetical protein